MVTQTFISVNSAGLHVITHQIRAPADKHVLTGINPFMAVAAIWRFEVITRTAVCLNPADMYLYAF